MHLPETDLFLLLPPLCELGGFRKGVTFFRLDRRFEDQR